MRRAYDYWQNQPGCCSVQTCPLEARHVQHKHQSVRTHQPDHNNSLWLLPVATTLYNFTNTIQSLCSGKASSVAPSQCCPSPTTSTKSMCPKCRPRSSCSQCSETSTGKPHTPAPRSHLLATLQWHPDTVQGTPTPQDTLT